MVVLTAMACGDQSARTEGAPAEGNAALRVLVSDEGAKGFYEARQWREAWTDSQEEALLNSIELAPRHGLDPQHFLRLIRSGDDAQREAGLTQAALAYAKALASGVVDPSEVQDIYTVARDEVDVAAGLEAALQGGDVESWLGGLAPADPEYKALSDAYLRLTQSATEPEQGAIPAGELLRPGKSDPRVPQVASALRKSGYYIAPADGATQRQGAPAATQSAAPASTLYTPQMVAAVKAMQAEYGLKPDGVIGADTLKLLNTSSADRARQVAVNMERRRWLPRTAPANRIDVNTAATFLTYFTQGNKAWETRVVAGKPSSATPSLGAPLHQLVVNPPWHVPKEIGEKEILPKGEAYMAKENMYIKDGQVIQRPGADSALGLVKFDLKNDHAIYLHDTPAKRLFAEAERHLSHGCVRVENPLELARLIADQYGKREQFETALKSGETKYIALGAKIPVRLLYHTAYVDESGEVAFRPDVYGWDEKLGQKLGLMPGTKRNYQVTAYDDMGP